MTSAPATTRRAALLAAAAAGVAGCSLGPPHSDDPGHVPPEFRAAVSRMTEPPAATRPWWREFRDPMLDALVEEARRANPRVARAAAAILAARAEVAQAEARGLPRLEAGGSYGYGQQSQLPQAGAGLTGRGTASASWEIDLLGRVRGLTEAARAALDAAEAERDGVILAMTAEVARAYVQGRAAQAQLAVVDEAIANRRKDVGGLRELRRKGYATEIDLQRAIASLNSAREQRPGVVAQVRLSEHALSALIGRAPGAVSLAVDGTPEVPRAPVPAAGLPIDLIRRVPSVRVAERRLAVAVARIGVAEAERWPSFSIDGNLTVSAARAAVPIFLLGPALTIPLFSGGALKAAAERARAEAEAARNAYRDAVVQALREVEDAAVRLAADAEQIGHLEEGVAAAGKMVEVVRTAYGGAGGMAGVLGEGGLSGPQVDWDEVARTQERYDDLRLRLARARAAEATDLVALFMALGGGYAAFPGR